MAALPAHRAMAAIIDQIRAEPGAARPRLALHSCCGPCSSHALSLLTPDFDISVLYFNPNIDTREEFERRLAEQRRLIERMPLPGVPVELAPVPYDPAPFLQAVAGHEDDPEGGERCRICYALRMAEAAKFARERGCDYFATTLSVSPHKNAAWIDAIGRALEREDGAARYLPADFKKGDGYRRSVELAKQYGLYRQDYCGCSFSKRAKGAGD